MSFLFTSDWQATFENLDLCERAMSEVKDICRLKEIRTVVFCGDLKHHYNPVDIRVVQFWQSAIRSLGSLGVIVRVCLGNHDRIGMYTDAQNWLDILHRSGASIYDKPDSVNSRLFFLPFTTSAAKLKSGAQRLAKESRTLSKHKPILVFHADILNAQYNALGTKSESRITPADLCPDAYSYCIGGHLHMHQKIDKNIYYTGSPFCTDWGEANQKKGYIFIDDDQNLKFIRSEIPGWFDDTWPNYDPRRIVPGSHIRLHVKCDASQDFNKTLEAAKEKFELAHGKDLNIFAVPEFTDEKQFVDVDLKFSDSDEKKISKYIEESIPSHLQGQEQKIAKYLLFKLKRATRSSTRNKTGFRFVKAIGKNVLSYKSLSVNFEHAGLVVVTGKSNDWKNRSNGVGKTNYLQTIPVALFGTTFKEQKYDGWAYRYTKDQALMTLIGEDNRGRRIKIRRSRRPGQLMLYVNGEDKSSGMGPIHTQELIESLTGFTWETLSNSVFVDQEAASDFLFGTQKQRKDILNRFQNLERFEQAKKLISADLVKVSSSVSDTDVWIHKLESTRDACKSFLTMSKVSNDEEIKDARRRLKRAKNRLRLFESRTFVAIAKKEAYENKNAETMRILNNKIEASMQLKRNLIAHKAVLSAQISTLQDLENQSKCPTCQSKIQGHIVDDRIKNLKEESVKTQSQIDLYDNMVQSATKRLDKFQGELSALIYQVEELEDKLKAWDKAIKNARHKISEVRQKIDNNKEVIRNKARLKETEARIVTAGALLDALAEDRAVLEYSFACFSREGIPSFLNAQICPVLNKSAEQYSDLFTGKEIQVRFSMVEGEIAVQILNAHGGSHLEDQSKGEKKLASMITSFALRDVAPPCNVLILDEPGDGLDEANAKMFARGLKEIKGRFDSIFLTSHNAAILSELGTEKIVRLEKTGRLSRVVEPVK